VSATRNAGSAAGDVTTAITNTSSVRRAYRVVIIQPPDFEEPENHRPYRFPRQGPAIVAASVSAEGIECQAADLALDIDARPFVNSPSVLDDRERLQRHLQGDPVEDCVALGQELIQRMGDGAGSDVDAFAISIDRHTQVAVSLLLGVELKRRFGLPIILGGANALAAVQQVERLAVRGVDLITIAESPHEIRAAFAALREVPRERWEIAREPLSGRSATPPDDWPVPDFSIYDLERYRRDPFLAEGPARYSRYDHSVGRHLMLPYHFSWDCQYACTFCARGGTQRVKSVERAVRDLATLAERYDCRDFIFFDAQMNLFAYDFAKALIAARLGVQWSDSFRVSPRRPPDVLDTMARSGCVGLTLGVESVSDRMLKRMVKGHTAAQATRIVQDAHAREIFVRVNLLPCFPGERPEDHQTTVQWLAEHARCVDEVVPSSFYLATNSPVLQLAERYGISVRERRLMQGDYKYRKNYGSLAYDEIDGYTWEEREAMLRPAEDELRTTWRGAREGVPAIPQPAQAFALRGMYSTKAECYAAVARWEGGPAVVTNRAPLETHTATGHSDAVAAEYWPDPSTATVQPTAPIDTPSLPAGSLCARALDAVSRLAAPLQLTASLAATSPSRLGIRLADARGGELTLFIEVGCRDGRYYARGTRLGLWYAGASMTDAGQPRWAARVLKVIAKLLLSPAFDAIADELPLPLPQRVAADSCKSTAGLAPPP
jgi:hypothetical protein